MRPERDKLLNYSGFDLLYKRYLIRTHSHEPMESVQEMYLGIALHLAMPEKNGRLQWVRKFYEMLSRLEVTMATPTLSNARKPYHLGRHLSQYRQLCNGEQVRRRHGHVFR